MIFYDLVNDGLTKEVENFFNDPEEYGNGATETELEEHIKAAFHHEHNSGNNLS